MQELSADTARALIEHHRFQGNRIINETQVGRYMRMMPSPVWMQGDQITLVVIRGHASPDCITTIDAHHRLIAQVRTGLPLIWSLRIFEAEDEAQVALYYSRMDVHGRARSTAHVISTRHDVTADYDNQFKTNMYRGMQWLAKKTRGIKHDLNDDIVTLWNEYEDAIRAVHDAIHQSDSTGARIVRSRMMSRVPSAIMAHTEHLHPGAAEFWGDVTKSNGAWEELLANYLTNATLRRHRNVAKEHTLMLGCFLRHRRGLMPTQRMMKVGLAVAAGQIAKPGQTIEFEGIRLSYRARQET